MQDFFILFIKQELNIYIFLGTLSKIIIFLKITILKFFFNNAKMFFWLNTIYLDSLTFTSLLINMSDLFNIILTYSKYFSDYL